MPSARKELRNSWRRELVASSFRTRMCRDGDQCEFLQSGRCYFAHRMVELRTPEQNTLDCLTSKEAVAAFVQAEIAKRLAISSDDAFRSSPSSPTGSRTPGEGTTTTSARSSRRYRHEPYAATPTSPVAVTRGVLGEVPDAPFQC